MQHYQVVIATPGHSLMAQYVKSLIKTIDYLNEHNITWIWTNKFCSHVGDAREITIGGEDPQEAFNSKPFKGEIDYDTIIWIDSDIAWNPEDFMALYKTDKDILAGAYLLANGQTVVYRNMFTEPYVYDEVLNMEEPVKVHGVGFGFLAVKKGVFESLSRPWFQSAMTTITDEQGKEHPFSVMGEDISWCERVKAQGFEIWFDPKIKVTHHKMMTLSWKGISA